MNELAIYGEVNIRKAYGNWENDTLKGWKDKRFDYALESIHQPPYSTNKNATDIKMTVDIMKILCQNNNISYVALATSDSDFTPLVTEIKSLGIQVIGFGETKTSSILQQACSEFLELNQNNTTINLHDNKKLIKLLKNAVENCADENGYALSSQIGTYLHNKTSHKAKNFGKFKTWGEILEQLNDIFDVSFITANRYNDTKRIKLK
jgi:uncharacterized protein (TIGR00288 family)